MKTEFSHNVIEQGITARHLVSWSSLIAGLLMTLLTFSGAVALGVAFGGIGLSDGASAQNAGIFTGVWFILSAVIALFVGGYVCVRLGKFRNDIVGIAHGLVIASLFILLVLNQTATAVGWLTRVAGDAASGTATMIGSGMSAASQNTAVRDMVEDAVGDLNLKSDPEVVVTGVTSRLLRGDNEGAKRFLARQSGLTPEEVDARIVALRTQVDQTVIRARDATATAMKTTGWSLFLLIVLGAISGALGGVLATQVNGRKPLARTLDETVAPFGTTAKV
jgi:hypothetical protein